MEKRASAAESDRDHWKDKWREQQRYATFPEGYVNEVNYDGTVKALAFLLGNECGVSHPKIRKLICELTEGEVELSDGMINGLCGEFSKKTAEEKQEIIRRLMTSPVMNADFTNANGNGTGAQVLVLASPSNHAALYIGKEKKGDTGCSTGLPVLQADCNRTAAFGNSVDKVRRICAQQEQRLIPGRLL